MESARKFLALQLCCQFGSASFLVPDKSQIDTMAQEIQRISSNPPRSHNRRTLLVFARGPSALFGPNSIDQSSATLEWTDELTLV